MRLDLEEFDFETQYIKGSQNAGADARSRTDTKQLQEVRNNVSQILAITI